MAKMKVHELAKEIGIQSKDICQALLEKGVELKPQSAISEEDAQYIRNKFSNNNTDTVKVSEKVEPKQEETAKKEAASDKKDAAKEAKAEKENKESKAEKDSKHEKEGKTEVKPKRIITTRGMVRPEGERRKRPRPEGERSKKPVQNEPKKKINMEEKFAQALGRFDKKEEKKEEKVETVETPVVNATDVNKVEKPVDTKKDSIETVKTEDVKNVTPVIEKTENTNTENANAEKANTDVKTEEKKETVNEVKETETVEKTAVSNKNNDRNNAVRNNDGRNQNRDNRGNDNRNGDFRNNRGDNRNNDNRNGDFRNNRNNDNRNGDFRNNRGDNRNNDNRNGDFRNNRNNDNRNGNFRNNRGDNRNNDNRNGDFRNNDRNNDRRRQEPVADTVIQDKDRKARENKLRQDKQDRNKKKFEDGQRGGRNGRGMQLQHKSMLQKPQKKKEEKKEEIKVISIPDVLTIGELAEKMKMQPSAIIKKLFLEGKMVTVNSEVDFATAEDIAMGFDIMCEEEEKVDVIEELLKEEEDAAETMVKRPPVVCVMGHVDHGKTSLLDAIKETNVISQEAGGITQHIGAYMVEINGEKITFLDTPGHEAFTAMRMRGAQSTDIAILVVAADDGVMPQTIEAINHAKAADIEIIVAINKIDKPGANIDRVKQELTEYGLIAEDWGGNTIMVPVSAHTKEGIDTLLEMVILQADVLELKANPNRLVRGLIIEAKLDKGKGSVATVLVQKGTLHVGDHVAAGSNYGRVRAMVDDKGRQVKSATPSTPVKILGLNGVPNAGEVLVSTETANESRTFAETFIKEGREKLLEGTKYRLSLDDLNSQIEAGNLKELNLIIKADVQGSVEAIKQSMLKLSNDEVEVKVIHGGVGAINESDVTLASASNAIIIGFNVKPDNQAQDVADREQVDVRLYSVIYSAIEDVEKAMKGMLDPVYEEKIIGHAEIRQIFKASGIGNIAGSYVLDGVFERGCEVRITREGEQIFEGPLASLKRFKDDAKEVKSGFECGLVFEKFNDIAEGDMVEAYKMVEVPR
ncbi:MAG: translation initiation factor IF-2 [Lachnospiraceae bacterium]|nr:translation initiation factor IF-2 [Lachnospiraceae bacterium]